MLSHEGFRVLPNRRFKVAALTMVAASFFYSGGAGFVQAGDDAGMRDFILSQAPRPSSRAYAPVAPAPIAQTMATLSATTPSLRRSATPRARYVSLPRAEISQQRSTPLPPTRTIDAKKQSSAVVSLMNDPTLRAGDIVVLADGPKVFKGGTHLPFALSSFEALERSNAISKAERKMVLAATKPGALLANEAKLHLAIKDSGPVAESIRGEASNAGVRMVYPSAFAQN